MWMLFGNIIDNVGLLQRKILILLEITVSVSLFLYGGYNFYATHNNFNPKDFTQEELKAYATLEVLVFYSTLGQCGVCITLLV